MPSSNPSRQADPGQRQPPTVRRRRRHPTTDPAVAVGYGRLSRDHDGSVSLEAQQADVRAWCDRRGVQLVAWAQDVLSGGTSMQERPGLLQALAAVRRHRAGLLVVVRRDRLARDTVEAVLIEREVAALGAAIVCCDGTGSGNSPTDVFQARVLDAVAELERGFIRARIRRALELKAEKRERISREPPFGYRFAQQDAGSCRIEPDPREQAIVQQIVDLRLAGTSYCGIARALVAARVPPRGRTWYASTVRDVCLRAGLNGGNHGESTGQKSKGQAGPRQKAADDPNGEPACTHPTAAT